MTENAAEGEAKSEQWMAPLKELGTEVESRVRALQADLLDLRRHKEGSAKAKLAQLRNSIGREPGSVPAIWDLTIAELPGRISGDDPTSEERAAHAALTLYALHQQSRDTEMHTRGPGLGHAVRKLAGPKGDDEKEKAVRRRFDAAATAVTFEEMLHHLRGLVGQLRSKKISLDYGQFADDLVSFQRPGGPDIVRRRWGRQYRSTDAMSSQNNAGDAGAEQKEQK